MAGIPKFLKVKDQTVYFNWPGKKFIFYVPEKHFDTECATIDGQYIELLGCISYSIIDENSSNYAQKIKTFDYPSLFNTKPGSVLKVKKFKILPDVDPEDYRLLIYTSNDVDQIISSVKVPEDIMNVEYFLRLFVMTGKIPKTIPYDVLQNYFFDSIEANGNSYKISSQMFGLLISEFARSKDDISVPFRLSKDKKQGKFNSYLTLPIAQSPKLNGPFNSLTSENWDESLIGAVLNPESKGSPLENIMMGDWDAVNR